MDSKKDVANILKKHLNQEVEDLLEIPPDQKLGDFALPCFTLAQQLKKKPQDIAHDLAQTITDPLFEKVSAQGPYLNIFLNKTTLATSVIKTILTKKETYGKQHQKHTIMVEYPSPNTNKPLHLGHIRNMTLGQSLSTILTFLGNKVIQTNLNNDRGVHICKSMYAYQQWGKNKKPDKKPDHFVGDFYVLYNKHKSEATEQFIQDMLKKWEQGDKEIRDLWKKMNSYALEGFDETYKKFGIKFNKVYDESKIYDKGKSIVKDGLKKKVFYKKEDGAIAIDLKKEKLGEKVVLRPDGTSVYITQDINLAYQKFKDFPIDTSIHVVGSEQIYHFKVLYSILKKLGFKHADNLYHLSYGMVYLPEGKMKSREGTVVDADDLIFQMESLAEESTQERHKNLNKKETTKRAQAIGMAAIRFYMLKTDPARDMHFDPKKSISFEGETGPYVQYTHARICSILKKVGKKIPKTINTTGFKEHEIRLVKRLQLFPEAVEEAGSHLKPSLIAHYLLKLAQELNTFYTFCPVMKEQNKELQEARLAVITAVKTVLASGLSLLNIESLEEM
jgi:arginyl-tRNA synthetase